jgi:hypothetical protein
MTAECLCRTAQVHEMQALIHAGALFLLAFL